VKKKSGLEKCPLLQRSFLSPSFTYIGAKKFFPTIGKFIFLKPLHKILCYLLHIY
jgi:hypothetical protein